MNKPNLFIVGTAKAGTTALHDVLDKHPKIQMCPVKEPNYFSKDIEIENFCLDQKNRFKNQSVKFEQDGKVKPRHKLYVKDLDLYMRLFADFNDKSAQYIGESSVSYLYSKVAAEQIYSFNSQAKIIIILRDPIDRAYSHFLMDTKVGRNKSMNFIEAVELDLKSPTKDWENDHLYIDLGLYYLQVKRYLELFPRKNILILNYDEFKLDNKKVLDIIGRFLGVTDLSENTSIQKKNIAKVPRNALIKRLFRSNRVKQISRKIFSSRIRSTLKNQLLTSRKVPLLNAEDRALLLPYFLNDIEQLENLLNREFKSWKSIKKY